MLDKNLMVVAAPHGRRSRGVLSQTTASNRHSSNSKSARMCALQVCLRHCGLRIQHKHRAACRPVERSCLRNLVLLFNTYMAAGPAPACKTAACKFSSPPASAVLKAHANIRLTQLLYPARRTPEPAVPALSGFCGRRKSQPPTGSSTPALGASHAAGRTSVKVWPRLQSPTLQ